MSFFVLRYDLDDELIELVRATLENVDNVKKVADDEHLLSQRLEGIYVDYVAFRKDLLRNEGVEMYESGEQGTTDREGLDKLPRSFLVKYDPVI